MGLFSRTKKSLIPDNLKNKTFKGHNFNSWFYLSSLEEAEEKGYPFSNACFEISGNIIIAYGTSGNESPRDFIDNNQGVDFIVDEAIQPMNLNGKQVYYAKRSNGNNNKNASNTSLDFVFKSYDHLRNENGRHVSGPHGGANRAVKVEPNISGCEGYTVTLYNLDGNHPLWQNNVQMAPKQMKIIQQTNHKIVLRGYGYDAMGGSFADYGLSIHFQGGSVEKCILHMHDRNVDIEYLKSEDQSMGNTTSNEGGLEEIQSFLDKWLREFPMNIKVGIAQKTDELNNIGCTYQADNDYENAILHFNEALEVMPINDDALKNLVVCYRATNNFNKMQEVQIKLDYLRKLGI